ncbi:TonB-dependent receptor plug domain-containing protein [Flavobacteriaceae bacterium F08102]|nr:TonB-dependent receptor plug domain-containing protein [Flavobacteriaceae bacterium F08102]
MYAQISTVGIGNANDTLLNILEGRLDFYRNNNPVEKVYLHTNSDVYITGEDIWFSGYVVLGANYAYSTSKLLYVDLVSPKGEIIHSQTQELFQGRTDGVISLPNDLVSGKYQLRAYTHWMRNDVDDAFFFSKLVEIASEEQLKDITNTYTASTDLQFFPEGGYAVAGLEGVIAFKAIGKDGLAKSVEGNIIDSKGNMVAFMKTVFQGEGFFYLTPKRNEQYTAVLTDGTKYPLPEVMDEGYAMTVNSDYTDYINIKVQATERLRDQPFYFIVHTRQKLFHKGKYYFNDKGALHFKAPTKGLPTGVVTMTLLDGEKRPWSERIVFVNHRDELKISVTPNQTVFDKRDEVSLDIEVTDAQGEPVKVDMSIAVTDYDQIQKGNHDMNMLNYIYLQSDIRGYIANPGELFNAQNRREKQKLDLTLLTHGWRRFVWNDVWEKKTYEKQFKVQNGLKVSGTAYVNKKQKPLQNKIVEVFCRSAQGIMIYNALTDDQGRFEVDNLNLRGEIAFEFKAFRADNRPYSNLQVVLDKEKIALPSSNYSVNQQSIEHNGALSNAKTYREYALRSRYADSIYNEGILLNEVQLKAKFKPKTVEERRQTEPNYGIEPDATIFSEDVPGAFRVSDLLIGRVAGVMVSGDGSITIRGGASNRGGGPLWVLDNVIVPESMIESFPVQDIERIEVLKGASTSMYGVRGAGGVILIYTYRGVRPDSVERETAYVVPEEHKIYGHGISKEFYSPKYDVEEDLQNKPDYRATLYWNSSVVTDDNGKATVRFFNSDIAKKIQVSIETMSVNGIPGAYLTTFSSENGMK